MGTVQSRRAAENRALLFDDVAFLAGTDDSERLAKRLGYSNLESLVTVLRRYKQNELARELLKHTSADPNRHGRQSDCKYA